MSVNRKRPPHVYFMRPVGKAGPVKIGCSQSPIDRLQSMSSWAPFPLELAAWMAGDEILERRFHAKFRDQHSHGEWFHPSLELSATIRAVASGTFDVAALPEPRLTPRPVKQRWTVEQRLNVHMQHAARRLEQDGIAIPEGVKKALYRYSLNGSAHHPVSRDRPDAVIIQAFLANHIHALKDARKLIEVSREAGFMDLAA